MIAERPRRKGGIFGALLKALGLVVVGMIILGAIGSMSRPRPAPGTAPAPLVATAPAGGPTSRPAPAADVVEDSEPVPGEPVPEAGEVVSLVNQDAAATVAILQRGKMLHMPNPTNVRVLTGKPKQCQWNEILILKGVYEVEVLDGEHRGEKGYASPKAMRFERPLSEEEKLKQERQQLIDKRKSKRARNR